MKIAFDAFFSRSYSNFQRGAREGECVKIEADELGHKGPKRYAKRRVSKANARRNEGYFRGNNGKKWGLPVSYCTAIRDNLVDPYNREYHDHEYGFPIKSDAMLFERLILEINQAGLSWVTILKKREAFRTAYAGFDPKRVAAFKERDRERLLADAGIIRNRLKIEAAIGNAKIVLKLAAEYGSFAQWLDANYAADLHTWKILFKKTFFFTGGEIVREFLVSSGYLAPAHDDDCPIYEQVAKLNPPWMAATDKGKVRRS